MQKIREREELENCKETMEYLRGLPYSMTSTHFERANNDMVDSEEFEKAFGVREIELSELLEKPEKLLYTVEMYNLFTFIACKFAECDF